MNEYDAALQTWLRAPPPEAPGAGEADPAADDIFGPKGPAPADIARVRDWVRQRFSLPDDAAISVSQVACNIPGCPPLETAVAFWTEQDKRHHFKLLKRVDQVAYDDLPYAWMKDSLILPEGFGCDCC